jgi:hypothetical protein
MRCKQNECTRRAHRSGWCTTHYRRWRSGQPMDAPIRGYLRYDETEGGTVQPVAKPVRVARQRPFAKELELLKELGLRWSCPRLRRTCVRGTASQAEYAGSIPVIGSASTSGDADEGRLV